MTTKTALLEVGEEIHQFLKSMDSAGVHTFSLDELLARLFSVINTADDGGKDDNSSLALLAATMMHIEGLPGAGTAADVTEMTLNDKAYICLELVRLGSRLRERLKSLYITTGDGRHFAHRYKGIERDHLLTLEYDDLDT